MTIRALGYSLSNDFDPHRPGRLCRGRERWITPWEPEPEAEPVALTRLVVSGAAFEDDSARDALRGLNAVGVDLPTLLGGLFDHPRLMVFTEDGHPADIPDGAEGIELYDGYRAGGKIRLPLVRWYRVLDRLEALQELDVDPIERAEERLRGLALLPPGVDPAALWERIFAFVGMSCLDSPPARYNPAALPDLLALSPAVVVLHRDKHGPVFAVYSRDALDEAPARLARIADAAEALLVPFAIPPMLARWDRALYELRQEWGEDRPFPVPRAEVPSHWEARRDRRKERREQAAAAPPAPAEE